MYSYVVSVLTHQQPQSTHPIDIPYRHTHIPYQHTQHNVHSQHILIINIIIDSELRYKHLLLSASPLPSMKMVEEVDDNPRSNDDVMKT